MADEEDLDIEEQGLADEEQRAAEFNSGTAQRKQSASSQMAERGEQVAKQYAKQAAKKAATGMAKKAAAKAGTQAAASAASTGIGSALAAAAPFILIVLAVILVIIIVVAVLVVSCNSQGWRGKIARIVSTTASWTKVLPVDVCETFSLKRGGGESGGAGATSSWSCTVEELRAKAVTYNTVGLLNASGQIINKNDPELDALIACVGFSGTKYTYENDNPACNITRGNPGCGKCAHAVNSCHYGGSGGTNGALAVDFAVSGAAAQAVVDKANSCPQTKNPGGVGGYPGARCENAAGRQVACASATHVHVTIRSCAQD